jgi:hypothetical protein
MRAIYVAIEETRAGVSAHWKGKADSTDTYEDESYLSGIQMPEQSRPNKYRKKHNRYR